MTRANWTLESVDGDFDPCSVRDFIDANRETFTAAEIRSIRKLRPGQTYSGGGGAWASWTVRRASDLEHNGFNPLWIGLGLAAAGALFYFSSKSSNIASGLLSLDTSTAVRSEYAAAVREFASAKGFHAAALLRKTDHPQDAAILAAYDATAARLAAATARLNAARGGMARLGIQT
jgi:hypothetical protein